MKLLFWMVSVGLLLTVLPQTNAFGQFEGISTLPSDLYVYSDTHLYRVVGDGLEEIGAFVASATEALSLAPEGYLIASDLGDLSIVDAASGARTPLFSWPTFNYSASMAMLDRQIYLLENSWQPNILTYDLDAMTLSSRPHTMSWSNGPNEGASRRGLP